MPNSPAPSLETRITGSFSSRFWLELFSNSIHFPIANILLELLIEKPLDYLAAPDLYAMITASLVQTYWLTRWQTSPRPRRWVGNLIGPAVYTLVELLLGGPQFFSALNHLAYWGFALVIGGLQTLRLRSPAGVSSAMIVAENVIRTSILFFMYAIFEFRTNPDQMASMGNFFQDRSHQFIGLALLFLGLMIGLANLMAERYLRLLKETSVQLKTYSEWLLGRDLLGKTFVNPTALQLTRRERTVLFMDIRSFTHWSENQSPEAVVGLLDKYYQVAESILAHHGTIKFKLSADEVMAVFATDQSAIRAALDLRNQVRQLLAHYQLGAGIGIHTGPLVEGLLGSARVKFYDVIGDTVNTAKRIESAAQAGEVLISAAGLQRIGTGVGVGTSRQISAKGKKQLITVYPLRE